MSLNRKMSDAHEEFLAELLGGRRTRASGAVWKDQMDGRTSRMNVSFAFAWDGKSTRGKSIGVTREMWEKAVEQAGGERPLLALRWYETDRLDVGGDLVVLSTDDFAELLEAANVERPPLRLMGLTRKIFSHPLVLDDCPPPLLIWDEKTLELDEAVYNETLDSPRCLEVVYRGEELTLPPDRRIDIYIDNRLARTLLPGWWLPRQERARW